MSTAEMWGDLQQVALYSDIVFLVVIHAISLLVLLDYI